MQAADDPERDITPGALVRITRVETKLEDLDRQLHTEIENIRDQQRQSSMDLRRDSKDVELRFTKEVNGLKSMPARVSRAYAAAAIALAGLAFTAGQHFH